MLTRYPPTVAKKSLTKDKILLQHHDMMTSGFGESRQVTGFGRILADRSLTCL
jgi:hypothetical protein